MLDGKKEKAANITRGKGARHVIKIEDEMDSLGDFAQNKAREFLSEAEHTRELSFNSMYFLILIALMITLVSALLVTKSITAPLDLFRRAADSIGKGKLDTRVDIHSKDEIGDLATSFNNMTSNLSEVTTSRDSLNIEVEERKKAEALAKKSLSEKQLLMKEVHHRIKNNLSVIQSLLMLQVRDITDDKSKQYFLEATNRVKSMSMIHERLHGAEDLTKVEPSEYIRSLIEVLFNNYKIVTNAIKLTCDVQVTVLDVDTMIPLGLIINELVSNALKYAFPDNMEGELSVLLHGRGKADYELVIKDTGVGLPEDFDLKKAKSHGLLIVNTLVNQINGAIEVSNKDGAEFRITFTEKAIK
jgi:two-component sensor histidine kinase/HAMP domain-containing protein